VAGGGTGRVKSRPAAQPPTLNTYDTIDALTIVAREPRTKFNSMGRFTS